MTDSPPRIGDQVPAGPRLDPTVRRLQTLHPQLIDLGLDRLHRLLARLDHPERRLPPVLHVAGTNGKGSTCAFLRAMAEAAGLSAHVYTSPHLVSFTERIRLAGTLVSEDVLADTIEGVEAANADAPITIFEVVTAAAFRLFATVPADICILETGLGGRFDATNVVAAPHATAITSISLDHRDLLGDDIATIAFEKAGIIKPGVPVVTGMQDAAALAVIAARAAAAGAPTWFRGQAWQIAERDGGLHYEDARGTLVLPRPGLPGLHQIDNAGIAIATLRASGLAVPSAAFAGIAHATWPARLQRLNGRLAARLPAGWELWLDGGHNPGAGAMLAAHLAATAGPPVHLIVGMKQSKDVAAFLHPLLPHARSCWAVAEPEQHLAVPVEAIVAASGGIARPGGTLAAALDAVAAAFGGEGTQRVLICGTLFLAGEALRQDGFTPR